MSCAFCKKSTDDVRYLVEGPGVNICDECVAVCVDLIADRDRAKRGLPTVGREGVPPPAWSARLHCSLCRMPVIIQDTIPVEQRGLLCRECIAAVQAAAAAR